MDGSLVISTKDSSTAAVRATRPADSAAVMPVNRIVGGLSYEPVDFGPGADAACSLFTWQRLFFFQGETVVKCGSSVAVMRCQLLPAVTRF